MNVSRSLFWFLLFLAAPVHFAVAKDDGVGPCAGRPPTFQVYEGTCLPDRLVGYLKCVEKTGGNRLKVSKDESSKSSSDVRIGAEGAGQGVIVKGSGKAQVTRKKVDETIKKLDETYGDRATETCLVAAGLKAERRVKKQGDSGATPKQNAVGEANPRVQQEVETGPVRAEDDSTVIAGAVKGDSANNVEQKVKVKGSVDAKNKSRVEIGTTK